MSFQGAALATEYPTSPPKRITAGDTVKWRELPTHPDTGESLAANDGWTLAYWLLGAQTAEATVTTDGADFLVTFSSTATSPLGDSSRDRTYQIVGRATKDGESFVVRQMRVTVAPDPANGLAGDRVAQAETDLAVIESVLAARITADVEAYQIAGRAVTKIPILELRKIRSQLIDEIAMARNGGRLPPVAAYVQRAR